VTGVTTPIPSANLPSRPRPGARIDARITSRIEELNNEVRSFAAADAINGNRPATRAEAELMVMRAQRDQLIGQVEDLRAELAPMVLALRFLGALLINTCGGEAHFNDTDLDAYAAAERGIEFKRHEDGDGWFAVATTKTTGGTA
jgi:hypothetical protein